MKEDGENSDALLAYAASKVLAERAVRSFVPPPYHEAQSFPKFIGLGLCEEERCQL